MKRLRMKHRVFLILVLIILLIGTNISLSLLENRYSAGPIYTMMDGFYGIVGFIDAFDECERYVTSYRWGEDGPYDPEQDRIIRDKLVLMRSYLDRIVSKQTVRQPVQYYDIRALDHMFPHYQRYIETFLTLMAAGSKTEAISVYYRRETLVTLIHDYSSKMLNDTVQESQKDYLHMQQITRWLWLLQVLTGIASFILSAYFAAMLYGIVQPINRLIEASEAMGKEDFSIPDVPVDGRNEDLRQLVVSFNHMKHSTRQYVEMLLEHNHTLQLLRESEKKALESRRLADQAKLLRLQEQIDPHFLFNALNTIRRIAQTEKAPRTETLILSLAKVFRHSLYDRGALSILTDEIEVTERYFQIQQARFGERIHLAWMIAPDVEPDELLVPTFALQILVENAVKHGLGPKSQGGHIQVGICRKGDLLFLEVADDGLGFPAHTLAQVRSGGRPAGTDSGVGLCNIMQRLQLLDPRNQLTIRSEEGKGSRVTIKMPIHHREEEDLC